MSEHGWKRGTLSRGRGGASPMHPEEGTETQDTSEELECTGDWQVHGAGIAFFLVFFWVTFCWGRGWGLAGLGGGALGFETVGRRSLDSFDPSRSRFWYRILAFLFSW